MKPPLIVPVLASTAAILVIIGIFGAIGADSDQQRLTILKTCGVLAAGAWACSEIVRLLDRISADIKDQREKKAGTSQLNR